uniref:Uncharacterized protein n=1 Tax=Timema tahoe TaxID=61484 RepID=A0A7R9FET3_9NEOP|nr:unnamed protein product [Timema tahoe]
MDERKFTVKIELEENLDDELHQDINLKSEMEGDLPIKSEIFLNAVNDYDLQDFEHVLINSLPIKEEPNVDEIEVKYFEEAKDYVQDNIQNYEAQPTHSLDPLRIEKEPDKSPSRHISNQCGSSLEKCKHSCGKAFLKQAEKFGAFVRSACKEEACPKLALRRVLSICAYAMLASVYRSIRTTYDGVAVLARTAFAVCHFRERNWPLICDLNFQQHEKVAMATTSPRQHIDGATNEPVCADEKERMKEAGSGGHETSTSINISVGSTVTCTDLYVDKGASLVLYGLLVMRSLWFKY